LSLQEARKRATDQIKNPTEIAVQRTVLRQVNVEYSMPDKQDREMRACA